MARAKKIIDEADPEGLLALGAPTDEYDAFSAEVARRLLHDETPADIFDAWPGWHGRRSKSWCIEQLRELQQDLAI